MNPKIYEALSIAARYGTIDGAHRKMWVIDQMVRAVTTGPGYYKFVRSHNAGTHGPDTYTWDTGTPP